MTPEEEAIVEMMEQQKRRRAMMGMDKEIAQLQNEMEINGHIGFCMGDYDKLKCADCPTEFECMKLYIKERATVEKRTLTKMKEVQDGNTD